MRVYWAITLALAMRVVATAQAAPPPAANNQPGKVTCSVPTPTRPSEAEAAFSQGKFADSERLYAAMPASSATIAGIVRSQLDQRKLDEALALIQKENATHPNDALLLDVLGEVRFRRGEEEEAAVAFNRSMILDGCSARTHYDFSRYMNFSGLYASAQRQLEIAHKLAPDDPLIRRTWESSQRVVRSPEEQVAALKRREESTSLTEEQKSALENTIKGVQAREKGDCALAEPVINAKIQLQSIGNAVAARGSDGAGLDVFLNGKRRRFKLDTGASGLAISREAAKALGLTEEARTSSGGLGDAGQREAFVSHVDEVRIGNMAFHNCMVEVFEAKNVLDGLDGLIGADVFRSFVVTLDMPGHEMRLSPLPKRPDETEERVSLGTGGEDAPAGSRAESRKDRYVAPEMQDWTRVFCSGHFLIFPTSIGNAPTKLFVMDTGAGLNLISPAAAREVTHVSADDQMKIHGVSGDVKNVFGTDRISLAFARVKQESFGMTAVDTSNISRYTGVDIAGFIGWPTLRQLVIQIDYRDNLVHVSYTPHIDSF